MKTTPILATGLISGALSLISCTPTQRNYGMGGAAAGAAAGALTGGDTSDVVRGAALGGAAGAGYGAYRDHQARNQGRTAPPQQVPPTQPTPPAPAQQGQYPEAFPSGTPEVVISPYKPYNKVRVKGFKPGDLARDPETKKIFVVPN